MRQNHLLFLLLAAILILSGCSTSTMGQAIDDGIPFNVKEILHKEKVKDGVILLYLTKQDDGQNEVEAMAAAYLKGSDKNGWKNEGHNHWEHYENEHMTVYTDTFYDYDKEGKLENRIPLIFGEIQNGDIQKVEVAGKEEKFEEAAIIKKENKRYYFKIGDFHTARGLSADGKEIIKKKNN
ncbi:hypothetical protein AF332_10195 [Sporosarcina globispora]|uniref:Lipoprotein n=1 Tax=Sporosarcina globispora TaxID=1459 RepID=A0A0M0GC78_SPOGL|nr:hypothetical protein [Sporosarcina globispora]KON87147.1 hypothetical protein AF332_10195 [Sporosarcina globispora]